MKTLELILMGKKSPVVDDLDCKVCCQIFSPPKTSTLNVILSSLSISLLTPFIKAFNPILSYMSAAIFPCDTPP